MIIFVYGPTLKPLQYRHLERSILAKLIRKSIDARGFDRKDVRIFFPLLAHTAQTVEVAIFGGSGISTTIREANVWKSAIEDSIAPYYPNHVINGFISKLDPTAQFDSVLTHAEKQKQS